MVFRNMSPSETSGNFPAALTQYFTGNIGLRLGINVSAFPSPHTPILVRSAFRSFTTVGSHYDLLLCLPSSLSRLGLRPAVESVYLRASKGLVTRAVAGYVYSAHWAICTGGTLTR
jgi:hypothetical protein